MSNLAVQQNDQQMTAFSSPGGFEAAQRMANALCSSSMVPEQYRGPDNIGNAIIALEMAQRMNASPLMVMQNLYMVHGNPGWSSKFMIATFNQCGRFSAIRYEWTGTVGQKDRSCRAYAFEKQTNERVEGPVIDWPLIEAEGWNKKNGSKWKTMPEKMFAYRAAAWLIDTVAPELSMGLPAADQIDDFIEVDPSTGEVLSTTKNGVQTKVVNEPAAASPMSDDEFVNLVDVIQNKIESGQKTADQMIEWLVSKGNILSSEQESTIKSFTHQQQEGAE
jgi:hypothetical protein